VYEDSAGTSDPVGGLSEQLAQASISDKQTQASSLGNYHNSLPQSQEALMAVPTSMRNRS